MSSPIPSDLYDCRLQWISLISILSLVLIVLLWHCTPVICLDARSIWPLTMLSFYVSKINETTVRLKAYIYIQTGLFLMLSLFINPFGDQIFLLTSDISLLLCVYFPRMKGNKTPWIFHQYGTFDWENEMFAKARAERGIQVMNPLMNVVVFKSNVNPFFWYCVPR